MLGGYLLRRAALAVVTLGLALSLTFVLTRASGDPVRNMLGESASAAQVAEVRHDLGLDESLPTQFIQYVAGLLQGDLGTSLRYGSPNADLIISKFGATLVLAVAALCIAVAIGVTMGLLAAIRENSPLDRIVTVLAVCSQSVPTFWVGLLFISIFAVNLGWFPSGGAGGVASLVLPALALSTKYIGEVARLTRSSMIDAMRERYISLARINGIKKWRILLVHALRNAAIPVMTMLGISIGVLLSGSVTIEYVFAWPGLGSLIINSVFARDFSLVQACVVFGATVFVLINFLTDVLYGVVDPRVRTN